MHVSPRLRDIHRINYLTSEMDSLYHQASQQLGISDSVSVLLYTLYDKGVPCPLSVVYKSSGVSKQTINSALRKLEEENILYLIPDSGRSKQIVLTEQGEAYLQKTAAKLFAAEVRAFDGWEEEEVHAHVRLMEKYLNALRQEIQRL